MFLNPYKNENFLIILVKDKFDINYITIIFVNHKKYMQKCLKT